MTNSRTARLKLETLEGRDVPSAPGVYAIGFGAGGPPRVQVFDTATHALLADFQAFEPTFTRGVNVAVGDVNLDGLPEVIVAAGPGGGPRVRVFNGQSFRITAFPQAPRDGSLIASNTVLADFFAFEQAQRGGVTVTSGNLTGTGNSEVITGAGPGGGPRVRAFDGAQIAGRGPLYQPTIPGDVTADFFAFEPTFRNGVNVSASPNAPGGISQYLVVAPGLGGGPRVRVLSGQAIAGKLLNYTSFQFSDVIADFFSGNPFNRGGAFVTTASYTTGPIDVAVGSGPGPFGTVTLYSGIAIAVKMQFFNGFEVGDVLDTFSVAGADYTNGVSVGTAGLGLINGQLLYGLGGQGVDGQAHVVQYQLVPGSVVNRVPVRDIIFDTETFIGVSN